MTVFVLTFCLAFTLPLSAFAARGMAPTLMVNVKDSAVVADVTTVSAQAASESDILKVEFSVDDQLRATLTKAPYEYKWDTIDEDEGRHTLIVAAYDGAGKTATRRIKVEVDNGLGQGVKPHASQALAFFQKGDYEGAMLEARKAYRVNMADPDAIRALAAATGGKGDYNRAIDLLEKPQNVNNQIVGDPKNYPLADPEALSLRGLFRLQRAETQTNPALVAADVTAAYTFWHQVSEAALVAMRAAHPESDHSPAAVLAVGDALYASGDYEGAFAQYEKVATGAKEATAAENRAALALIALQRWHDAEQRLNQMIAAGRGNDATHAILAAVYLRQYRFEQARAEVLGPAQRGSLSGLLVGAYADLSRRQFDHAFDALKRVAARAPTAEPEYLAACLFTDARDMKRATAAVFAALRLAPAQLDTYVLRGYQLATLVPKDGFAQASALFDFVLQHNPNHADAKLGKTMALIQQKRYRLAEPLVRELQREDHLAADVWVVSAAFYASGTEQLRADQSLAHARNLAPERFPDVTVPLMTELAPRVARYRRPPLLTPVLLQLEEAGK